MRNWIIKFVIALLFIFFAITIYSQTGVGKLNGRITDINTREPLIGANVIIFNTGLGAATNTTGEYFILNINPGTYSIKISYVGYAPKTILDVRIVPNITYELNIELTTDFSLPEVVIEGRKFFEEKATNTVRVFDSEQISKLPVRGISRIASLQSGVVIAEGSGGQHGDALINVRGGRNSEVLYIVDGIPQNDLFNRTSTTQVSNNAIEQLSFQVGGYQAKYGQAQSGIINVTTKSGQPNYSLLVDLLSSTFTDDYGYNLYSSTLSGPIIPNVSEHTIFLSAERGWFKDANPPAIKLSFPSINKTYDFFPDNPASALRLTGKTNHKLRDFHIYLSAVLSRQTSKHPDYLYFKNDSKFLDEITEDNYSFNARVSQTLTASTFWNLNLGYRLFDYERYNPFFKNDLMDYGDSTIWANKLGITLEADGRQIKSVDEGSVFHPFGYARGLYEHRENDEMRADIDISSQIENHLIEIGAGISQTIVRSYSINAYLLAGRPDTLTLEKKFEALHPYVYGYDITGSTKTNSNHPNQFLRPYKPLIGYAYIQDRFELEDLVINAGLRMDYFNIKSYELIDPSLPYAGGSNPGGFDPEDFKVRDAKIELSPRIGIGFPVTESTVFHVQYGRFIQLPGLEDIYSGPYDYRSYIITEPVGGINGGLENEETTQYETGLRQLIGHNVALNLTLFYKNIKGLVNVEANRFQRTEGGEILTAIYPTNSDFGTIKGLAFSFDVTRLNYFNLSFQYTFSLAEGTGSTRSSSQMAVFRNGVAPKVIAPLSFDQRHTGVINLDFYIPKGNLGWLEMFDANFLFSFNSGRPYTPVDKLNLLGGLVVKNLGYINSAYGPGSFRIDMKVEKTFPINNLLISPYIWIENLFDADNVTSVYGSTGSPTTTGWFSTPEGKATVKNASNTYIQDYMSLERNPWNFGIPRLIKLGLKVNFTIEDL